MGMRSKIVGTGMCVPDQVITNDDLAVLMDTSDEWIKQRSEEHTLNSSHVVISYAVFCLKKKKQQQQQQSIS